MSSRLLSHEDASVVESPRDSRVGEYMDKSKVAEFFAIPMDGFLVSCEIETSLACRATDKFCEFRKPMQEFMDRLIVVLLEIGSATSVIARLRHCFCPELMIDGDNSGVFELLAELCDALVSCGVLPQDESKADVDEHSAYIIEKRTQHDRLERAASVIAIVTRFLLNDFGFQSGRHAFGVFKLCGLVGVTCREYPTVTFDLSGCSLG